MQQISAEVVKYYEAVAIDSIDLKLKKQLYEVADKIVEEYMRKTEIRTVFTKKSGDGLENDILVIQMKATVK